MQKYNLPDTQNITDTRQIAINKTGIKDLFHPIVYIDRDNNKISTVGNFTMTVALSKSVKGTHMSRFIEVINDGVCEFGTNDFYKIVQKVVAKLQSNSACVTVSFPFFKQKAAPSSGIKSIMNYQATFCGTLDSGGFEMTVKVVVPVTSLCPCSKSISKYGAHNQRSHITINVKFVKGYKFYLEELIDIAEHKASCELYAILKRDDEKFVTEKAYENPAFVEDLVRDIAVSLNNNEKISYYCIESENFESIHNHSAYALIENYK